MTARGEMRRGTPRFRVRYCGTWYELAPGDFFVGRSAGCQFVIDDPRVSRKHARFHIESHRITLEDLRSRNGTLVNGVLLRSPQVLTHDDLVTIGPQELRIATVLDVSPTAWGDASVGSHGELDEATQNDGLSPLCAQLDRHARTRNHDEIERTLALIFDEFYATLQVQSSVPTPTLATLDGITHIVLAHTATTQHGAWVDRLFTVYHCNGQVMPNALLEELTTLLPRIRHPLSPALREYAEWARGEADRLSPPERFAQQRLEGLLLALRAPSSD